MLAVGEDRICEIDANGVEVKALAAVEGSRVSGCKWKLSSYASRVWPKGRICVNEILGINNSSPKGSSSSSRIRCTVCYEAISELCDNGTNVFNQPVVEGKIK